MAVKKCTIVFHNDEVCNYENPTAVRTTEQGDIIVHDGNKLIYFKTYEYAEVEYTEDEVNELESK